MPSYKDEVRGTWYCSFYYTDWTGKKKKKKKEGFKTQREAKAFERDFLDKAHASPDMTFGSLVQLYLEDCKSRVKPTTYATKEFIVINRILPFFKDMPINEIEPATIRKWQNDMISQEDGYSQTYLKTINNQFSAIFNFAVKYYKLGSNPVRLCGSMGQANADKMLFWTLEEFKLFIKNIEKPNSKVAFEILFWTGMRLGELLALTLKDFDFNEQTVLVHKNYARLDKQDIVLDPKTKKSKRSITIPNFLCLMVKDYADKLYDYHPNERLFQFSKHFIHSEMTRGSEAAGVKRIRIHDLRHSHASLLIEQGFSPLLISERLGHENIQTTLQTYSHLYPNKHGEVADKLEKLNLDTSETIVEITEKIK